MLVEGLGVEGDAHFGDTVKHRSQARWRPRSPNLRQVHLIHAELLEALAEDGYRVAPGDLGENITTRGIDLLGLAAGTLLRIGEEAVVEVTGLRNPCVQLDRFQDGLLRRLSPPAPDGGIDRLAGVMGVVRVGGGVRAGDGITVQAPRDPRPLRPV